MRSQALYNDFHDVFLMCLVGLKNMNILHMYIFWKGPFFDSYYKYITFYHNSFLYGFPAVSVFGGSHRGAVAACGAVNLRGLSGGCLRGGCGPELQRAQPQQQGEEKDRMLHSNCS
jgi:hypothetical protein